MFTLGQAFSKYKGYLCQKPVLIPLVAGTTIGSIMGYIAYENSDYRYWHLLKTNQIDPTKIPKNKMSQKICTELMRRSTDNFKILPDENKTPHICSMAVKAHARNIRHVPQPKRTDQMFDEIMLQDPDNIKDIPESSRTQERCDKAIKWNPYNITYIPDQMKTPSMKKFVVEHDSKNIKHFEDVNPH